MQKPNPFEESELDLLSDPFLLPEKQRLMLKVEQWLARVQLALGNSSILKEKLPLGQGVSLVGKISKGENLNGQAYRVLDCPSVFDNKKGFFACRTVFIWGHSFSCHFLLSGEQVQRLPSLMKFGAQPYPVYLQTSGSIWEHFVKAESHQAVHEANALELGTALGFFKTVLTVPLAEVAELPQVAKGFYESMSAQLHH